MEKDNHESVHSRHPVLIKGTSWLLDDKPIQKQNKSSLSTNIPKLKYNHRKWKKNSNNRFEAFAKTMQKTIASRFKRQNQTSIILAFDSLRKTETQLNTKSQYLKHSHTFHTERKKAEDNLFRLQRKQQNFGMQIRRVDKLKETTHIFQQKKHFYDNCIEEYFTNEQKDINKTISKLAHRSARSSNTGFRC